MSKRTNYFQHDNGRLKEKILKTPTASAPTESTTKNKSTGMEENGSKLLSFCMLQLEAGDKIIFKSLNCCLCLRPSVGGQALCYITEMGTGLSTNAPNFENHIQLAEVVHGRAVGYV